MWATIASAFRVITPSKVARPCGDHEVAAGRKPVQMGWYEFASDLVKGRTVLDVGCGSGDGLKLLSVHAKQATGIEVDERLKREDLDIEIKSLPEVPDCSTDVTVCVDVIEHIEDDREFARQLVRVAREAVFVSTPNYAVSRNEWPFHVREYTPRQFESLFAPYGEISVFGGDSSGDTRKQIKAKALYYFVNDLYCRPATVWLAKLVKRILLMKVWPHQGLMIYLERQAAPQKDA
jgi:2-polyprenyl-3-methyl-5-hydroxy-6-metoxy-1,4-benzoquinol methylase